jgi:uncharacterized protein (TIGR00369 family)
MSTYEAGTPDYAARIRKAIEVQGFMKLLQVGVGGIGPGHFELTVRKRPDLLQQGGLFHGGLIATLIDNATTAAAATLARPGWGVLTAEYKLNILSPGLGDGLICRADVVKPGRMLTVVEGRVFSQFDDGRDDKLVATGLASIANIEPQRNQDQTWAA